MAKVIKHPALKKAEAKAKRDAIPVTQWECRRCKHDIGVATSAMIRIKFGPMIKGLSITGGRNEDVCAYCWQRGVRTPIV